MIFLSDDDLDTQRLVKKWLQTTSFADDTQRMMMQSHLDALFYKALDFVLRQGDSVVDTTLVGILSNALSQVRATISTGGGSGNGSKAAFLCALIRGLGANLSVTHRTALAKEVFSWAGERPPDLNAPLDCYADGAGGLVAYAPPSSSGNGGGR